MFEWLNDLFQFLGRFFPCILVVRSTHRGIRFRRGAKPMVLEPGVRVYWPLLTEVKVLPWVRQTCELAPQVLTTADGKDIAVSAVFAYEIVDPVAAITGTFDIYRTIEDFAQGAVASEVTAADARAFSLQRRHMESKILAAVNDEISKFGVEANWCRLINVQRSRTYRIIQDHTALHPEVQ